MKNADPTPLGLRLRRARKARGLSQTELAERAGVSQPLVSYYERSAGSPEGSEGLERIAAILGVPLAGGTEAPEAGSPSSVGSEPRAARGDAPPRAGDSWTSYRRALLESLGQCELAIACFDRPAPGSGADLAFALQLRSHVLVAVLDGAGSGTDATLAALLQGAALLGAQAAAGGLVWPYEHLGLVADVPRRMGAKHFAASFLLLLDLEHGVMNWAGERFPTPLLRNGKRVHALRGERTRDVEAGRIELDRDWMLLVGTDGIAHRATRGQAVLFDSREVRQLLRHAGTSRAMIEHLEQRTSAGPVGPADDAFALAITAK